MIPKQHEALKRGQKVYGREKLGGGQHPRVHEITILDIHSKGLYAQCGSFKRWYNWCDVATSPSGFAKEVTPPKPPPVLVVHKSPEPPSSTIASADAPPPPTPAEPKNPIVEKRTRRAWTKEERAVLMKVLGDTGGDREALQIAMLDFRPDATQRTVTDFIVQWAPAYRKYSQRTTAPRPAPRPVIQHSPPPTEAPIVVAPLPQPKAIEQRDVKVTVEVPGGTPLVLSATRADAKTVIELLTGL